MEQRSINFYNAMGNLVLMNMSFGLLIGLQEGFKSGLTGRQFYKTVGKNWFGFVFIASPVLAYGLSFTSAKESDK